MTEVLRSISVLEECGLPYRLLELPQAPKDARDIVRFLGCRLSQVIKTVLFVGDRNVFACVPGGRKVDIQAVCDVVGVAHLRLASEIEVRELTGYEVGGVCPFVQYDAILAVLDRACLAEGIVNIGAGTKTSGIELAAADLGRIWPGIIGDIAQPAP